jgi:DNA-directed RNA polymerase subunit RPC12/RpoP
MSEYLCLSCLAITKESELNEGKCPKCDNDHLMKTYNASDSVIITNVNLYK